LHFAFDNIPTHTFIATHKELYFINVIHTIHRCTLLTGILSS